MVLLTLLGLTALFLRERKEVKNTHSGQDEKEDQSDVVPASRTDGQTSQQITGDPEVLTTEEELTGHPEIDGDGIFQDFIGDSSERSAETLHASDDGLEEDYSEPLPLVLQHQLSEDQQRDGSSDNETESDSEVHEVPVPADDTPGVLNKVLSGFSSQWTNWWERESYEILTLIPELHFLRLIPSRALHVSPEPGQTSQQITSDPEVLTTEEELTGHPEIDGDSSERSGEALHAFNNVMYDFNVNSLDIPQVPVSAVSDCKVDITKASENPTEDTVAPQSSQLKHNETTIMDISAFCDEICIQQSDDGLEEDYSELLPLVLQHQLSEDQQRDGASDNETESEVPEVPVPADDTPGVHNKVLSGLSSKWKNRWERFSGNILTLTVIFFFLFFFIANYLSPLTLMMSGLCVQIKFFKQIITTGYRVYHSYHMPWFRTLSLYFLLCVNNYFYGETLADYFFTLVQMEEYIHMFSKYQHFISFTLYLVGFCMFVLSLVRKHYRLQFYMFAWTHVTLLIVAMHSHSIIQDLFDGSIWVIVPISICNDIMAWMFGFIISCTFFI